MGRGAKPNRIGARNVNIRPITLSYNTEGKGTGGASGPEALLKAGLVQELEALGHVVLEPWAVQLSREEENEYGGWNRVALANGHLSRLVARARQEGSFVLALLADCNGLLGVLGGLQSGALPSSSAGFVYVDAHGDYNTPDTSPSGMLGGMPVAVAAGKCLPRLRRRSGMAAPISYQDILMAGMRDLDDLEREAIGQDGIMLVREDDLRGLTQGLRRDMSRLKSGVDVICVHVDLDILDPGAAPAAGLPSPGGLTGEELGRALSVMLACGKAAALSIASYRADKDSDGKTLEQVMESILRAFAKPD